MELLTPEMLAEWLHLSRRSVYELCSARGQQTQKTPLPFFKVAGKLRFNKAAVQEWLQRLQGDKASKKERAIEYIREVAKEAKRQGKPLDEAMVLARAANERLASGEVVL